MKTFQEYMSCSKNVKEARETGVHDSSFSRQNEWDNIKNTFSLLSDKVTSNKYKLWRSNKGGTFFLSDENNNYLGFVEGSIQKIFNEYSLVISSSHSVIKGGFYNIMFTNILGLTNIKYIISDSQLSTQAINSYEKLSNVHKNGNLKIQILSGNDVIDFSRESLIINPYNRVLVSDYNLHELFSEYTKRINNLDDMSSHYNIMFNTNNPGLNYFLYCESLN